MGLILGHLLAFALAAVGIAFGDLAIFRKRRVDTDMLATAQTVVKWSLYGLWATGLAVIWLDTKFDLAVLATKPKLLAKLSVVALSANGWLLHRVVFNRFTVAQDDPDRAAYSRPSRARSAPRRGCLRPSWASARPSPLPLGSPAFSCCTWPS
jgi:hypothetical protein